MSDDSVKILILDDDTHHLRELSLFLRGAGYCPLPASEPSAAASLLAQEPALAIVDLFLEGDRGSELSNGFILEHLEPAGIPYLRMTSAPKLVEQRFAGEAVIDKQRYWAEPESLLPVLQAFVQAAE